MYFYAWSYRCLERHDGNSGKEWSYEKDCKDNVSLYPLAVSRHTTRHKANEYIAANMAANILGLGWVGDPSWA